MVEVLCLILGAATVAVPWLSEWLTVRGGVMGLLVVVLAVSILGVVVVPALIVFVGRWAL